MKRYHVRSYRYTYLDHTKLSMLCLDTVVPVQKILNLSDEEKDHWVTHTRERHTTMKAFCILSRCVLQASLLTLKIIVKESNGILWLHSIVKESHIICAFWFIMKYTNVLTKVLITSSLISCGIFWKIRELRECW